MDNNKKKKIRNISIITGGVILALSLIAIPIAITQATKETSINTKPNNPTIQQEKIPRTNYNYYSGLYGEKINKKYDRSSIANNTKTYITELEQQYSQYGFKYPGYDNNYEGNKNENSYINVNNQKINISNLVFNERANSSGMSNVPIDGYKYSDWDWIKYQIDNNQLKKHPAANNWYIKNVTPQTQAVEKEFVVGSTAQGATGLGLYAPAGEIIELELDNRTYNDLVSINRLDKVRIIINQNYWNCRPFDNDGRISNRYPFRYPFVQTDIPLSKGIVLDPKTNKHILRFGSPFGGSLTLYIANDLIKNNEFINLNFKIRNAVQMIHFVDNQTSIKEWNQQIQDYKNNLITAPVIDINGTRYSAWIPFTNKNELGYINLNQVQYPGYVTWKWEEFFRLSGKWRTNKPFIKIALKYCDDIWGGAVAWGGANDLSAPISWSKDFTKGYFGFNTTSWGNFHEVNHNFHDNQDPFNIRDHGWTNVVTLVNLSYLDDDTKKRNLYYPQDAADYWSVMSNPFANIKQTRQWYSLYAALIYTLGSSNFMNWTIDSFNNNFHATDQKLGFQAIQYLCDYFKLNFTDAFSTINWIGQKQANFDKELNDPNAIAERNRIKKDYPAIDFVGNMYATSQYLYNPTTNSFIENEDQQAELSIPANEEYVFDFEKGINSYNNLFNWSDLKFDKKSKLGVELKLDPNNNKKLIYSPIKNSTEIDEFNVSIKPGNWANKSSNYVKEYKWKIKLRPVYNKPLMKVYPCLNQTYSDIDLAIKESNKLTPEKFISYEFFFGGNEYLKLEPNTKSRLNLFEFNFIAPKTGDYSFYAKVDDYTKLMINNTQIYKSNKYISGMHKLEKYHFEQNEVYNIKFYTYNSGGNGFGEYQMKYVNKDGSETPIDLFEYSTNPDLKVDNNTIVDYTKNNKYKFTPRHINEKVAVDHYINKYISRPYSKSYNNNDLSVYYNNQDITNEVLDNNDNTRFEDLNYKSNTDAIFNFEFKKYSNINKLKLFAQPDVRANHIKIYNIDDNNNENLVVDKPLEMLRENIIDFNNINTKKLKIILTKNSNKIGVHEFRFSFNESKPTNYIPVNSNIIKYSDNVKAIKNEINKSLSSMNVLSLEFSKINDEISFVLENSKTLFINGTLGLNNAKFDLYIDDQLVNKDVSVSNNYIDYNQVLLVYPFKQVQNHKIKIVNKYNEPLYISGFSYN